MKFRVAANVLIPEVQTPVPPSTGSSDKQQSLHKAPVTQTQVLSTPQFFSDNKIRV